MPDVNLDTTLFRCNSNSTKQKRNASQIFLSGDLTLQCTAFSQCTRKYTRNAGLATAQGISGRASRFAMASPFPRYLFFNFKGIHVDCCAPLPAVPIATRRNNSINFGRSIDLVSLADRLPALENFPTPRRVCCAALSHCRNKGRKSEQVLLKFSSSAVRASFLQWFLSGKH